MNDKAQKNYYIGNFCLHNQLIATFYIYKEGNLEKAKNCYYEAALAQAYGIEKLGHDPFRIVSNMLYCILSDNKILINKFVNYKPTPEYEHVKDIFFHLGTAMQAVLKDDKETLLTSIEGIKKRSTRGFAKAYAGASLFFEGIFNNDTAMIRDGVFITQKKLQRHQMACTTEYMNIEATGLLKLAWLKGFEIPSTSTFIPQIILPVYELSNYESHDFFTEPD